MYWYYIDVNRGGGGGGVGVLACLYAAQVNLKRDSSANAACLGLVRS